MKWKLFPRLQHGFTLPELIIVVALVGSLLGLITINLTGSQGTASLNAAVDILTSELKQQQVKSMVGDTEGRASSDVYGVYFEADKYTLFHGSPFNNADLSNVVIPLDDTMTFSVISLPSSSLIFSKGSGEISGYVAGSTYVTIQNTATNGERTINFNKYGVITSVN